MLKLLYFYASWATPCTEYTPFIHKLIQEKFSEINLQVINADEPEHESLLDTFEISSVPSVVLLNGSVLVEKIEGFEPYKLEELLKKNCQKDSVSRSDTENASAVNIPVPTKPGLSPALTERLTTLINQHKLMMFIKGTPSRPQCGFTATLLKLLEQNGITDYSTFNIFEDEQVRAGLKLYSDWPTFPQIYINGEFVGGLDIAKEMIESGDFQQMLQ